METKNLTCIVCPVGCSLTATLDGNKVVSVTGNTCKRGEAYGIAECTAPTRVLTSTVRVEGGTAPFASVKSKEAIPKGMLFEAMEAVNKITLHAPCAIGDVVIEDLCGSGIPLVTTKGVKKR